MKKILMLLIAAVMFFETANAQIKSGILQKDYYGKFTANQWEGFLAGNDAKAFEEKATVKLKTYLVDVNDFVKKQLNEKDIAGAMDNSIKKAFPADVDVYTSRADGSWITRKTYPGEEGFYHVPTGTYWLSFECGNLCNFKAAKALPSTPGTLTGGGNPTPGATPNNAGINISINGQQQGGQDISWRTGKSIADEGRNDYRNALYDGLAMQQAQAGIFIAMQNAKQCCGQQAAVAAVPATPQVAVLPTSYVYGGAPQGGGNTSSSNEVTVMYKPNGLDYANTIANVADATFNGINTFRGIKFANLPVSVTGYNGSSNWGYFGNNGALFQDQNQEGIRRVLTGTVSSSGNNEWPGFGNRN